MINYTLRLVKRFLVLVPGIVVTYFAIRDVFPVIDRRVPAGLAVFVTYLLSAYILIPAVIRVIRILLPPRHIPHYCTTPDGFASDPINIGIEGSREDLIAVMTRAGWYEADRKSIWTLLKAGWSLLTKQAYPHAPFSALYLFGRGQDIGFQLPVKNDVRHRHHVRFWASNFMNNPEHHEHVFFWRKYRSRNSHKKTLWVGAASLDKGFTVIRHNFQVTHMIEPNTNKERDLIIAQLTKAGVVKNVRTAKINKPYTLPNRAFPGYLEADGQMKIVELKKLK